MGETLGFSTYEREIAPDRPVAERVRDWREVAGRLDEEALQRQGARCMDCGVPFCHAGCPLGNLIPDFNDLVYRGRWREAAERLQATNNFPELTARVCPAPCESACVAGLHGAPIAIKQNEKAIADRAWDEGWIQAHPPARRTEKKVAVVGAGPAGMAAAQQLNRVGHTVTLFERQDRVGGLMRYGIPDFKLEKHRIDRRVEQIKWEGVLIRTSCHVGVDVSVEALRREFDAVVLTGGATRARTLTIPGHEADGIHPAMDFLKPQNQLNAGDDLPAEQRISAQGRHVVVIGGGDTGSDCVGTSVRQGARSVTQIEIMPMPPDDRTEACPWPYYPMILRTSTSHEEGCERRWAVVTKQFEADANGRVARLHCARVEWETHADGRMKMKEVDDSDFVIEADLVLLALGFVGPETSGLIEDLGVELDARGNVRTDADYRTSLKGVFAAGDMRRGQSLVVWCLAEGREAARAVDLYLMDSSDLPTSDLFNAALPPRR